MYINSKDKEINILMWGPTQSGKTWLIDAFCHKVNIINGKLLEPAGEFRLSLVNEETRELVDVSDGLKKGATRDVDPTKYQFLRQGRKSDLRFEVSTHQHSIILIDAPGAHTTERTFRAPLEKLGTEQQIDQSSANTDDPTQPFDEDKNQGDQNGVSPDDVTQAKIVQGLIRSAEYIVLLLDLGAMNDPKEYLKDLNILRSNLKGKKRYIAACLPKVDKFGTGVDHINSDVEVLRGAVDGRFQNEGKKVLKVLDDMINQDEHELLLCASSAVGFINTDNRRVQPNWDKSNNEIMNLDEWNPQGVELPFFWLFQQIELDRLQKPFDLSHGLFQRWFGMYKIIRQEEYITYREMLDDAREHVRMDKQAVDQIVSTRIQTF